MNRDVDDVIVAIDNIVLRNRVSELLQQAGYEPVVLETAHELKSMGPLCDVAVLETNDDVAALSQIVYELYMAHPVEQTLPIIALLSKDALRRNPKVGMWEIKGRAAITSLVIVDHEKWDRMILQLIPYLKP